MTIHYAVHNTGEAACGEPESVLLAMTLDHVTCDRCREVGARVRADIEAVIDGCVPQDLLPPRCRSDQG